MTTGGDILFERIRDAAASEYEVIRQIGAGGMATVFLARDIALGRLVAIKVMRPELIDVERVQDRFLIEARTAAQLDHHGIVTVYAIRQAAGLLFIVMRYIEGRTLDEVLRERAMLEPSTVAAVVVRVADALHFAHGKGVVHRDVKPSNILIDSTGEPSVTDFGIARVAARQGITMAGSMLGTPAYMSPEQFRGMPVTPASDQYSLGIMTYQMLTGRTPFSGEFFELIEAHKNAAPTPISHIALGVDSVLEHTVMRMMAKDPAERWPSLAEVAQRLVMTSASPRELEQMQATVSFFNAARESLTPPPFSAPPTDLSSSEVVTAGGRELTHAAVVVVALKPVARRTGRALLAGAAALAILIVTLTVIWSQRSSPVDSTAARDSVASRPAPQPVAQTPTAPAPVATPRDTAPVVAKPPVDSAPKKVLVVTPPSGVREPTAKECARLLERVSLGEKLTEAEQALLNGRCRR